MHDPLCSNCERPASEHSNGNDDFSHCPVSRLREDFRQAALRRQMRREFWREFIVFGIEFSVGILLIMGLTWAYLLSRQ